MKFSSVLFRIVLILVSWAQYICPPIEQIVELKRTTQILFIKSVGDNFGV